MNIVADLHTHTNVSHHAVSSFEEMIAGAKRQGHKAIAITNHAREIGDGAHNWHFGIFRYIPHEIDGIYIIGGGEANIRTDGSIDIDKTNHAHHLDYIIASIHDQTFKSTDPEVIEQAYKRVLENPFVNTFGHIGTPKYKFNYENIISKCNEYRKIVEINCGSFESRQGSIDNCREIMNLCKKYSVPIAITSDAHISYSIGRVEKGIKMVQELDFPQELIINISEKNLQNYFKDYRGIDIFNR
ncbi:MAG: PHP domain-containing protein [Clostridia bacterium]